MAIPQQAHKTGARCPLPASPGWHTAGDEGFQPGTPSGIAEALPVNRPTSAIQRRRQSGPRSAASTVVCGCLALALGMAGSDAAQAAHRFGGGVSLTSSEEGSSSQLTISSASWSSRRSRLSVSGSGTARATVQVVNAYDPGQTLGSASVSSRRSSWSLTVSQPSPVPCRVRAIQSNGQTAERDVSGAPSTCSPKAPTANQPPVAHANGPYSGTAGQAVSFNSAGSSDPDGSIVAYAWSFGDGGTSSQANPTHTYGSAGTYSVSLTVTDNNGAKASDSTSANIATTTPSNQPPVAHANGPYSGTAGQAVSFSSAGSSDPDGSIVAYAWSFGDGGTSSQANPTHTYGSAGTYTVGLTVTDNNGAKASDATTASIQGSVSTPNVSINSTSQGSVGVNATVVAQQPSVGNSGNYSVLAINDLGMHCGDLDTRVASILPPFQVLLAQVIQKGSQPVLNPAGVSLYYSAAANPNDPILGKSGVLNGLRSDGSTYKTNFWATVAEGAYDPFYPALVTPLLSGLAGATVPVTPDVGLPVPNVEDLFIGPDGKVESGDEFLSASQHTMPGLSNPYIVNLPQQLKEHYTNKPFFVNFPFGYVADGVNWYEGAGTPFSAFDDFGRENPYPLVQVQAKSGNTTVATLDTVLPISGEASCTNCHSDPADVPDSRTSEPTDELTNAGLPVLTSLDDPDPSMPHEVSVEYAADVNILRLHDLKQGARYVDTAGQAAACDIQANAGLGDANCLSNQALVQHKPVVCQVCHYTPALDLAQVGPVSGPPGTDANGRNQLPHESNSRVMHHFHGQLTSLFPAMPAPIQGANGSITNQSQRLTVLAETCYQCHPGKNTQCLRGAMFNAGMLCNDCHGDMLQVGNDFSKNVSPANPGAFVLNQGDFYTPGSAQPRVPWANEPSCGSCHTGDATSNLAGTSGTLVNTVDTNGNTDGIRLRQAWRTGDAKATPIVPSNKRFAEPAVAASFNGFANPAAGNPRLYRVSTGHGGVMCEGCHGATHAEWPNANPASNDNLSASELQGHTGTIIECSTCHGTAMDSQVTLNGPHGMHPVGNDTSVASGSAAGARVSFVAGGHDNLAEGNSAACAACHGGGTRSANQGTVLSVTKKDRQLHGRLIPAGTPIGCSLCHSGGGD